MDESDIAVAVLLRRSIIRGMYFGSGNIIDATRGFGEGLRNFPWLIPNSAGTG
jgi:hypothetical protein